MTTAINLEVLKALRTEVMDILAGFPGGIIPAALFTRCRNADSMEILNGVLRTMEARGEISTAGDTIMAKAKKPGQENGALTGVDKGETVTNIDKVYRTMDDGPMSTKDISQRLGMSMAIVNVNLNTLKKRGKVREVGRNGQVKVWAHHGYRPAPMRTEPPAEEPVKETVNEPAQPAAPAAKKPPLGLVPEFIYEEAKNAQRIADIMAAMERYSEAALAVPVDWVRELRRRSCSGENVS